MIQLTKRLDAGQRNTQLWAVFGDSPEVTPAVAKMLLGCGAYVLAD